MVDTACKYETTQEGDSRVLVIDCRGCENDFDLDDCLQGVILSFEGEYDVEKIILSDYIERQYSQESLLLLKRVKDIAEELNRLSSRETDGKGCEGCPLNPTEMYPGLKEIMLSSLEEIFSSHLRLIKEIMSKEGCTRCRRSAKEELTVIGEKLLDLRSDVLLKSYGVLR